MAEEEVEKSLQPSFPTGRVKRIVKLDKEINKLTSKALLIISASAKLFIQFLTELSAEVAGEKKQKMEPDQDRPPKGQARSRASSDKPTLPSVHRINSCFHKLEFRSSNAAIEKENEGSEQEE